MKSASMVILCILFTGVGLVGGWLASAQRPESSGDAHHGHEGHAHENGKEHGHEGHDHGPAQPKISAQTKKNLGVTVAEVNTQAYHRYKAIPASVAEPQSASQPLYAPAGGTVMQILVQDGAVVKPGTTILRILRDPLPRPALTLTEDIIKPAGELFHSSVGEVRRALRGAEILKTELDRVKKFTLTGTQDGLPVLPRKNEIDLRYELARAEQDLENAREKLRLHGLADDQIKDIEGGKRAVGMNEQVWRRALQLNGLWTEKSEALYQALPAATKEAAWTVGAIGELTGAGLLNNELIKWMKEDPKAGAQFLEIAALMQQGTSLFQTKVLYELNALNPIIDVKAPNSKDVSDWDLHQLEVSMYQKVDAGTHLLTLANSREMILRTNPVGAEIPIVLNAIRQKSEIEAAPQVDEAGPRLKGLTFQSLTTDDKSRSAIAVVRVPNEPLNVSESTHGAFRTWQLREGQRYMLRIPTQKYEKVFVLPSGAVTDDGPDKIVFVEDGDSFKPAKVVILYQDDEVAVLDEEHSEIYIGDSVVQHGAFGLGLALKAGSGAVDPHAGHSH